MPTPVVALRPTLPRPTEPSIPVSEVDIEELTTTAIIPPRTVTPVNDITPVFARSAITEGEAKVIVHESDQEWRARVEAEVLAMVRQALIAMTPAPPKTDNGASVRWLLVGVVTGALAVYVMMAGALHDKEIALSAARTANVPAHVSGNHSAPSVLAPAPKADPPMACSATGDALASTIPTVDVNDLPKHPTPRRFTAPRKSAPAAASNLDEENPYADDSNPYANVSPE